MIYPEIPLPRLLNSDDLTKTDRFIRPISVDINQKIVPLSYASMTLPQDESVPGRSYVELFTSTGSAGIYRVTSPQDAFGEDVISCELEHAITEVGDWVYEGELYEMIPAKDAIGRIFNSHYAGNKWQLGSTTALGSTSVAVEISYRNVLEGILGVLDQVPTCMMTFDFSTTPWTFGFAKRGTTVQAEGRLSRNVTSAKITYDDSSLCTRAFYQYTQYNVDGSSETKWAHKDAEPSSKTKYGIVERPVSTGSGYTKDEAEYVVNRYLAKHKKPLMSISIEAIELSSITGESLDRFKIGRKFRLALPDYGIDPVEDVITELSWKGLYSGFEQVTVNLGDQEDGVVNFLHDVDSSGGSSSGGRAGSMRSQQNNDFWTAINRTDYAIKLEAYERVKYDDWNYSYIDLTASYIRSEVGQTANGLYSRIEQTASSIRSTVEDRYNSLRSYVTQTASSWDARVEGVVDQYGRVTAASIGVAINKNGSNAYINADHVNITGSTRLSGHLTVENGQLKVTTALAVGNTTGKIVTINNGAVNAPTLQVNSGGKLLLIGSGTGERYELNASNIQNFIKNAAIDGNNLKLWKVTDGTNPSITFSKATTLTGKWDSGTYEVKASPQDKKISTTLGSLTGTGDVTTSGKFVSRKMKVQYIGSSENLLDTGAELTATINASSVYNVEENEIQIEVSSGGETSKPANAVEIWSNRPGFVNQMWYKFKVTVRGRSKWYAFYAKQA